MIPEVEEIIPHIEGADVEIWLKLKGLEEPLKPHNISDGTLRILAIISALYGGFSLVVLEEPEWTIYMGKIEKAIVLKDVHRSGIDRTPIIERLASRIKQLEKAEYAGACSTSQEKHRGVDTRRALPN